MIEMQTVTYINALFVAWQQPVSRRYYPVARLVHDNGLYEFVYTKGALEAVKEGFQPFLAFSQLNEVYRSPVLFPFFANRVMPRSRPDFGEHVSRLGLTPEEADDMSALARSGGVRATDSLELFQLPVPVPGSGHYETYFMVHGFRYLEAQAHTRVLTLKPGEKLVHEHEKANKHDPNAIRLWTEDGVCVGYMPRYLSGDACHLLNNCFSFEIFVEQVNPPPAPVQQRLLCRVVSCWPEGFRPCATPAFQPIPADATPTCEDNPFS